MTELMRPVMVRMVQMGLRDLPEQPAQDRRLAHRDEEGICTDECDGVVVGDWLAGALAQRVELVQPRGLGAQLELERHAAAGAAPPAAAVASAPPKRPSTSRNGFGDAVIIRNNMGKRASFGRLATEPPKNTTDGILSSTAHAVVFKWVGTH